MADPMPILAWKGLFLISWLRKPYQGSKAEVKVDCIYRREYVFTWNVSVFVTVSFYFILKYFDTSNIIPSRILFLHRT